MKADSRSHRLHLLGVGCVTLFVTFAANRSLGRALFNIPDIASSCIASATAALVIYLSIRPTRPFAWASPFTPWKKVYRLSALWLCAWLSGSACFAFLQGSWQAYAIAFFPVIGLLVLGPITEELLLRGAVFELAERSFPSSVFAPVFISTILFSAYHLQIHAFEVTPFVLLQLGFTLPLGFVLASLRSWSGSLWPGLMLHVVTNLPHVFGAQAGAT